MYESFFFPEWFNSFKHHLSLVQGTVEMFEKTNETIHYDLKKNDTEVYSYDIFSSIIYHQQLLTKNCQVLILRYMNSTLIRLSIRQGKNKTVNLSTLTYTY